MHFDRTAPKFQKLIPDLIKDYPDAIEEIDPFFSSVFGPLLQTMFLVDTDHAHELKTFRFITGLIGYVGSTLVICYSKRQCSIASSVYSSEFSVLRTVIEEAQTLCYMMRYLGCNIPADGSSPTRIFGDNLNVILNSQNLACDISKKYVTIYFHVAR